MSLVVVRAVGLVTVQDLGRPGHMHEAVPPGGALVRGRLVAANRAAKNPDDAPAIEVIGQLAIRAEDDLAISVDGEARTLGAGEELVISARTTRAAYLAVRGGIAAPRVLGGCGTLLCAGLGRLLRAGDRLEGARAPVASVPPASPPSPTAPGPGVTIGVVPGPDLGVFSPEAIDVLESAAYQILPQSDRVGTRLAGPVVPRARDLREVSRPMVRGAIEIPGDGQPIVLGPEHPTTGGYPVLAVVADADLDQLFAIPLGGSVRFRRVASSGT